MSQPADLPGLAALAAPAAVRSGVARASPARLLFRAVLFALVAAALALCLRVLHGATRPSGFASVDTRAARIDAGPGWFDSRWEAEVQGRLAPLGPLDPEDPADLARAVQALERLSFVASVGAPAVLWPDRLRLELRLEEPAACLHAGREFAPITAAGRVLSGRWRAPPARGSGFLPVVLAGPPEPRARLGRERTPREARAVRSSLAPGTVLVESSVADGLAVARSLWAHLDDFDASRLGRIVIDARAARAASLDEPGTILWLENGRRILFGRSPNLDAPGELPAETKWRLVSKGLDLLEPRLQVGEQERADWSLLDVRWDQGAIELRHEGHGSAEDGE